jgi:hypothetical protein
MFYFPTLSLLIISFAAVISAEPPPTGSATVWELVNCWRNADGYQSSEVWRWDPGNTVSTFNNPNWKTTIFEGGSYFWQAKTTFWFDPKSNKLRNAHIMDGVSSNNNGLIGISLDGNFPKPGSHGRLNSHHLCRSYC